MPPKKPNKNADKISAKAANRIYEDDADAGESQTSTQLPQSHAKNENNNNPLTQFTNAKNNQDNDNNRRQISFGPAQEALENSRGPKFNYEGSGALNGGKKNRADRKESFHPDPLLASTKRGKSNKDNNGASFNDSRNEGDNEDARSDQQDGGGEDNTRDLDDGGDDQNHNKKPKSGGVKVNFADEVETVESSIGSEGEGSNGSSDSGDPNSGTSSGTGSSSSGSSNAKRTRDIAKRPMVLYMSLLIAVPVLFLTIYQGIAVGNAQATLAFMNKHQDPVDKMLDLQRSLQDQLQAVSELIGLRSAYGIAGEGSLPWWVPQTIRNETARTAAVTAVSSSYMSNLILEISDPDNGMPELERDLLGLPENLARAEIDANRNMGSAFRSELFVVMEKLTRMFAVVQQDSRARLFQMELVDMQVLVRISINFRLLIALYGQVFNNYNQSVDVLTNQNASFTFESECIEFAKAAAKVNGFANFLLKGSADDMVQSLVYDFLTNGFPPIKNILKPFIGCDFRNVKSWYNLSDLKASADVQMANIRNVEDAVFLGIVDNKSVQQQSVTEGLKLFAALLCCIIGVVIVIWIQQKEKKELLQIIMHAERLSVAVRRFVPKNQLRMMGVRTVLQIEPGVSVEVANTLIHSDIRNFTHLSEKISRMELFDWLQMYVARMAYVVRSCRGFIDSMRGDGLVSVFPGSAVDGVNAAIMMQQETDHMNVDLVATRQTDLIHVGIGGHSGVVVSGVFGDENRLTCTMVAADVTLCSKMEEMTKAYGIRIMLSRAVIDQIDPEMFEIRALGTIEASSVQQDLEIFELYQADSSALKHFKNTTKDEFEKAIALAHREEEDAAATAANKREAREIFLTLRGMASEAQLIDAPLELKLAELESGVKNTMAVLESIVLQAEASMSLMGSAINEALFAEIKRTPGAGQLNHAGSMSKFMELASLQLQQGTNKSDNNNNNNTPPSAVNIAAPNVTPGVVSGSNNVHNISNNNNVTADVKQHENATRKIQSNSNENDDGSPSKNRK